MILFFIIISLVLIAEALESMFQHYILEEYNADGAAIRLLMNALCGAGLLLRLDKYNFSENARTLVSILSKTSFPSFVGRNMFNQFSLANLSAEQVSSGIVNPNQGKQ